MRCQRPWTPATITPVTAEPVAPSTDAAIGPARFTDLCTLSDREDGRYDAVIDPILTIGRAHPGAFGAATRARR